MEWWSVTFNWNLCGMPQNFFIWIKRYKKLMIPDNRLPKSPAHNWWLTVRNNHQPWMHCNLHVHQHQLPLNFWWIQQRMAVISVDSLPRVWHANKFEFPSTEYIYSTPRWLGFCRKQHHAIYMHDLMKINVGSRSDGGDSTEKRTFWEMKTDRTSLKL